MTLLNEANRRQLHHMEQTNNRRSLVESCVEPVEIGQRESELCYLDFAPDLIQFSKILF